MKRLTNEEIVEIYKQKPDRDKIFYVYKNTLFIANRMIRRYKGLENYDDIRQVAHSSLYEAALKYDHVKCPNYYSWIYLWCKKQTVLNVIRYMRFYTRFDKDVDISDLENSLIAPSDPLDTFLSKELYDCVHKSLKVLPNKYKTVINNLYLDTNSKVNINNVAKEQDISYETLSENKKTALRMLGYQQVIRELY